MKSGDHLVTPRFCYEHHGLFVGNNSVIAKSQDGVELVDLDTFSEGHSINVYDHAVRRYSREESVSRAYSRLGEDSYNVVFDNCEHFVNWCINGLNLSHQVNGSVCVALKAMEEIWQRKNLIDTGIDVAQSLNVMTSVAKTAASKQAIATTLKVGSSITAGIGTTAALSTGTASALATGIAATSLSTIAAPIAIGIGAAYGVKRLLDWFSD